MLRGMNLISCNGSALGYGVIATVQPFIKTVLQTLNVPRQESIPLASRPSGHCELEFAE